MDSLTDCITRARRAAHQRPGRKAACTESVEQIVRDAYEQGRRSAALEDDPRYAPIAKDFEALQADRAELARKGGEMTAAAFDLLKASYDQRETALDARLGHLLRARAAEATGGKL